MKMPEILRIAIQQLLHREAEQRVQRQPSRRFSAIKTVMVTPAYRRFTLAGIIGVAIVALMSPPVARVPHVDLAVLVLTLLIIIFVARGILALPAALREEGERNEK